MYTRQLRGNIHPYLENPDGPWTHDYTKDPESFSELNQQRVIINPGRSFRVERKITDILEQLISSAVEETERNDSSNSDHAGDGGTESEVEDQASEDYSDENEDKGALSCQFCNKLFSKKGNKDHHENYVHKRDLVSKSAYFCKLVGPQCEKFFSSMTSLRYHQLRAHGKAVTCEKCLKEFTDFKEFVKHRRSERGKPEIPVVGKCRICKIPISSRHLKRHMSEVHQRSIRCQPRTHSRNQLKSTIAPIAANSLKGWKNCSDILKRHILSPTNRSGCVDNVRSPSLMREP